MVRKLCCTMQDRDRGYMLLGLVEVDGALAGGKRAVLFAVERRGQGAGYLAVRRWDDRHRRAEQPLRGRETGPSGRTAEDSRSQNAPRQLQPKAWQSPLQETETLSMKQMTLS